jgi:enoyl-CoA hydratase
LLRCKSAVVGIHQEGPALWAKCCIDLRRGRLRTALALFKMNSRTANQSDRGNIMPHAPFPTDEILVETKGSAGIIRLNRPRALNSLTLPMVQSMKRAMDDFCEDSDIGCVILTGEGERGLCAGGDIRVIHDAGKAGDGDVTRFWREEFPLNYAISRFPKPYVALMDGIVMGGGVGLSAHGSYRVVTERTRLAMPETGIGYFPDVGASWLLPQAPGECGTWLGLTGSEIGAADAIHAGLADFQVPSDALPELIEALCLVKAPDAVGSVIERFSVASSGEFLNRHQELIDDIFRFDSVEKIIHALESRTDEFSLQTLQTLQKRSPTSLKLTLRLLRLGRQSSGLVECLDREFAAGAEILRQHDFYEGVRAALIDKDRNPQWKPALLAEVKDVDIDRFLTAKSGALFSDHRL